MEKIKEDFKKAQEEVKKAQEEVKNFRDKDLENRNYKIEEENVKINRRKKIREKLNTFTFKEVDTDEIIEEIKRDNEAYKVRLPFINKEITENIVLIPGGLYLIGAISGTGKTTTCAAMTNAIISDPNNKPVLVLSNEEKCRDFFSRVACLQLSIPFNKFHDRKLDEITQRLILDRIILLKDRIQFINDGLVRSVEGIQRILTSDGITKFSAVFLDYMQGVRSVMLGEESRSPLEALECLKQFLTEWTPKAPIPLTMFMQLKPLEHLTADRNIEGRIKWCTSMYEAGSTVMEAINYPKMLTTVFYTQKARFGNGAYTGYPCRFDNGNFITIKKEDFAQHVTNMTAKADYNELAFNTAITEDDTYIEVDENEV